MNAETDDGFSAAKQSDHHSDEVEEFQAFDPSPAEPPAELTDIAHLPENGEEIDSPVSESPLGSPGIQTRKGVGSTSATAGHDIIRAFVDTEDDEIQERPSVGATTRSTSHNPNKISTLAAHRPAPLEVDEATESRPAPGLAWDGAASSSYMSRGSRGSQGPRSHRTSREGEDSSLSLRHQSSGDLGENLLGGRRGSFDSLAEEDDQENDADPHATRQRKKAQMRKTMAVVVISVILLIAALMALSIIEVCRLPFCAAQCIAIGIAHLRWEQDSILATKPNRVMRIITQFFLTAIPFALGGILVYLQIASQNTEEEF